MSESPASQLQRERELARTLLGDGYAQDHIDQDELDRRLEQVEHATSVAELHGLTAELRPSAALVPVSAAATQRIPVLFGSVERVGAWRVAQHTHARVILGSARLDLRQAILPAGVTEIEVSVNVVLGNLEIVLPPGWQVDNQCGAVLSSVEQDDGSGAPGEQRRVLRLTGRVVLGSLSVFERLPGEYGWEAWLRRRGERKALAKRSARALGRGDE